MLTVNQGRAVFKVEGRDLLTDDASVDLLFIGRITDVSSYSPGFIQMFALYLAAQLADPLTGSQAKSDALLQRWALLAAKARMLDGIEDLPDDAIASPFVGIRA